MSGKRDRTFTFGYARRLGLVALTVVVTLSAVASAWASPAGPQRRGPRGTPGSFSSPHISELRSGTLPTREGMQLVVNADTGSVRIFSDATNEVRYEVRVETEQGDPAAAELLRGFSLRARNTPRGVALDGRVPTRRNFARVWVSYEVHIPARYNLQVSTQAGDILAQDINGQMVLTTGGGNIQAGRAGVVEKRGDSVVRLETGGGHILVGDVSGGLRASTAGGHITAGNVRGDAVLRTEGGHIQVGKVSGSAQLTTGGGNIVAAGAGADLVAETAGGRVEFGEAAGMIRTRTGGGGVRIARVAGATQLNANEGRLFLAGIEAPLRASTASGAITAWFSPQFRGAHSAVGPRAGTSAGLELASGQGDIVVFLPREIAVTIDALIEQGANHSIVADPALALNVRTEDSAQGPALRARAALNGGGPVLHLRTGAGNIQLRSLDAETRRRMDGRQTAMMEREIARQRTFLRGMGMTRPDVQFFDSNAQGSGAAWASDPAPPLPVSVGARLGFTRLFDGFRWSGVRVDPDEQQKRLVRAVRPAYPEAARQAGLEGNVTLRVVIGADGVVREARALSGEPELARAALEAVAQWRYAPALFDGRPVAVVAAVTLAFRLR